MPMQPSPMADTKSFPILRCGNLVDILVELLDDKGYCLSVSARDEYMDKARIGTFCSFFD